MHLATIFHQRRTRSDIFGGARQNAPELGERFADADALRIDPQFADRILMMTTAIF